MSAHTRLLKNTAILSDQSLLLFIKGGRDAHDGELSFCYYAVTPELEAWLVESADNLPRH